MVNTDRVRRRNDASVHVDVNVCDADVDQPSVGLEGYVAGVTEYDNAAQSVASSGVAALASVPSDAVLNDEVSAVDEDADPVPVGNENVRLCGVASEDRSDR